MNWKDLDKKAQLNLYKECKELYNTGATSPLEDFEYDELEEHLGLANKGKSAAKKNPKYTVEHPVVMGSLSKVQIKNIDGVIDWDSYYEQVMNYLSKSKSNNPEVIITPKFDGCSFEINVINGIVKVSGRGDGNFGPNYSKVLGGFVNEIINGVSLTDYDFIIRGEVLIDKNIFVKKYSKEADPINGFKNPRSFVSGVLSRDYTDDSDYLEKVKDLSIVIYDFKVKKEDNKWFDNEFTELINCNNCNINKFLPSTYFVTTINNSKDLEEVYNKFVQIRKECAFALDGIVIKPINTYRKYNETAYRPKDCVAIKFMPMMDETEVVNISWNLAKTGELVPTIITNVVNMDGKDVSRASASNYGKLINDKISIGTKVVLSLAGDIIPFIYDITDTSKFDESKLNIPAAYETYVIENGGTKHLMAVLSEDDKKKVDFITSINVLGIPSVGGSGALSIWDYISTEDENVNSFFEEEPKEVPNNILFVSPDDICIAIGGKNGNKAMKGFKDIIQNITISKIVQTCNFRFCGKQVSEQIEKYLLGEAYDFASMAKEGYEWVFNKESDKYNKLMSIIEHLGYSIDFFIEKKKIVSDNSIKEEDKIPVILTGEPNDYKSKGEFMKLHPEYKLTGKWTEVKIVFTNSLESTTGKMKNARAKNIEIRLY